MPVNIIGAFINNVPIGVVGEWSPAFTLSFPGDSITANFGASSFVFSVPVGYVPIGAAIKWDTTSGTSSATFSNGDLSASGSATYTTGHSTFSAVTSGKYYWEVTHDTFGGGGATAASGIIRIGEPEAGSDWLGSQVDGIGTYQSGNVFRNGAVITSVGAFAAGTTIRHQLDLDAGTYSLANGAGGFITPINL